MCIRDRSIAWKVAEKAVEEGASITLSNTPVAVSYTHIDVYKRQPVNQRPSFEAWKLHYEYLIDLIVLTLLKPQNLSLIHI